MQKNDFIQLLTNPSVLADADYRIFTDVIDKYPLFTVARIMQLIAARKESPEVFQSLLKKHSAHLNSHKHLSGLIYGYLIPEIPAKEFTSINSDHKTTPKQADILTETKKESYYHDSSTDLLSFDYKKKGIQNNAFSRKKKEELIERFITGDHGSIRADKDLILSVDVDRSSTMEDDDLITDTLARIYVKQGLYSKAIYAYEKLILKYPIKSAYFASQIEEIKKLINK